MINFNSKIKTFIILVLIFIFHPIIGKCFEVDFDYTNEYKKWLYLSESQKNNAVIPGALATVLVKRDKSVEGWWEDSSLLPKELYSMKFLFLKSTFNLDHHILFNVPDQGKTQECWAFSIINSLESNLKYTKRLNKAFSVRHMDYATSRNIIYVADSELKYDRDVRIGGIPEIGLSYLTNGQGVVFEDQMPFINSQDSVTKKELDINPSYYVTDYVSFPNIFKEYDADNNVKYFDSYGNEYSNDEVTLIRNKIKYHLSHYGSIIAVTASSYESGYEDKSDILHSRNFCCKNSAISKDHVVSIVGWDDKYSKENFNSANKPKKDGAYIVMQSYGEDCFDNGYLYISYEDSLIESLLYGITNSQKYDYNYLYQNDYYGGNGTLNIKNCNSIYYSTSFARNKTCGDILTKVSVNIPQESAIEVWVNPNGTERTEKDLIKVSDIKVLKPGYHTITIKPTKLTGDNFTIVIKQKVNDKDIYFNVEFKLDNIFYSNVNSNDNSNMISVDGKNWFDFKSLIKDNEEKSIMQNADLCIKAFCVKETNEK